MTPPPSPGPVDPSRISPARRYNALVGGKDNLAVDRNSAQELREALPAIGLAAAELRRCLERQVTYLAATCGVRQFLDIGCGLPQEPNVHEIAQEIDTSCRVVYVDSDLLVGSHARALLVGSREGVTEFVPGDLTDAGAILIDDTVREALDFDRPIAVLLLAVLHFVVDDDQARQAVDQLTAALPPGSYVAITHVTFDPLPPERTALLTELAGSLLHGPFRARTAEEVLRFFDGLELVDPGLVPTVRWHPELAPQPQANVEEAVAYAAIGRRR